MIQAVQKKINRREQILQSLAQMLENQPGSPITTAKLANAVGVSEAALYRHFPSKAKMFEGLISFIEETLFSRINRILQEEKQTEIRCNAILTLILTFAEKNPGMCRILNGDALAGETDRLRQRVAQLFDRLDTQLKQVFRETEIREDAQLRLPVNASSNLALAVVQGRIGEFVRTEFAHSPTLYWKEQWAALAHALFIF
ncbi:nucleoid occlusion factor SlmA [Gynuella sp.]|uniref:nucleoid occlusion factor SlmA n=1 Tax=Gynuella sp. TaxID=2969146 RepID=UPI003D0B274C